MYLTPDVSDGFSGEIPGTPVLLTSSWAAVASVSATRLNDYGLSDYENAIQVDLRHRNDLDYRQENLSIRYKGIDYVVQSVENRNLEDVEIRIIATR